jgi:ankyrin repeat protein
MRCRWHRLSGYGKVVQLWLDKGANINVQGARYGNALQAASIEGHEKVAQLLLDRGTVANAQRWGVRQQRLEATLGCRVKEGICAICWTTVESTLVTRFCSCVVLELL